jgi:hypothetical protein
MTPTVTCRHYTTVDWPSVKLPEELEDPEGLLVILAEEVPDARFVTLVFDVTTTRSLQLIDIQPHVSHQHGMDILARLRSEGASLWFAEEHAAWTDHGWIDVEALEGEPMLRAH